MVYTGPLIDAHHHLWDLSMDRHPWLRLGGGPTALGDLAYLRHDYLPEDYLRDSAGVDVAATVCIEALWDRAHDPDEEIAWLDGLDRPERVATRYVAAADFAAPDAAARLRRLAAHPRVAGVRQAVRWHPDPARSWASRDLMDGPAWRQGAAGLAREGLVLELLMSPWQAKAVHRLASDLPDLTIVVNHCSSPIDRDAEGLDRWRRGLEAMAEAPNVHLKLSNFVAYAENPSLDAARAVLLACLDAFGARRCLWGSEYPVARKMMSYQGVTDLFRRAIGILPDADQAVILFGNAARLYRLTTP